MTSIALYVCLALLSVLAIMQVLLMLSVPIGHFAWGCRPRSSRASTLCSRRRHSSLRPSQ
jgi:hypothetical protein